MNIEMFFVQTGNRDAVIRCVQDRLGGQPDTPGKQPDWGLESSYDALLAREPKRKVAISPIQSGWVAGIESKEVLDFEMLQKMSARLSCEVVACQLASVVDSCGYARCFNGELVEKKWSEDDPDPLGTLRDYLGGRSVPFDLLTFREVIQMPGAGWQILERPMRG